MTTTFIPTHDADGRFQPSITVATITTSLSDGSVSTRAVEIVEGHLAALGADVVRIDVAKLPPTYVGLDSGTEWAAASELVAGADAVVVGLGIHGWAPSAISKTAIEMLGSAMTGKAVAFVAGMGSIRSHLAHTPLAVSLVAEREILWVPNAVECTPDTVDGADTAERAAVLAERLLAVTRGVART